MPLRCFVDADYQAYGAKKNAAQAFIDGQTFGSVTGTAGWTTLSLTIGTGGLLSTAGTSRVGAITTGNINATGGTITAANVNTTAGKITAAGVSITGLTAGGVAATSGMYIVAAGDTLGVSNGVIVSVTPA